MSNPLITFFVCAYNQEQYVRDAVAGALAQTYSPLEILLTDDCSKDRTFEIMREMAAAYKGPHQIILNRNQKNLGVGGHVNRICELSHGELLVGAAGDDISVKDRTQRIVAAWIETSRKAFSIYSNMIVIDSKGAEKGIFNPGLPPIHPPSVAAAVEWGDTGVYGCSQAFHRDIFKVFGPIDESVIHEDVVIPFRSVLLGTIKYLEEPLVYYRRHDGNMWAHYTEIPTLDKRRQTLRSDRASLLSWLGDLRKAGRLGIISDEECERLQEEVIEHLREKSVESQFYKRAFSSGSLRLCRRYLGWRNFRQILRLMKRRWQSARKSKSGQ